MHMTHSTMWSIACRDCKIAGNCKSFCIGRGFDASQLLHLRVSGSQSLNVLAYRQRRSLPNGVAPMLSNIGHAACQLSSCHNHKSTSPIASAIPQARHVLL